MPGPSQRDVSPLSLSLLSGGDAELPQPRDWGVLGLAPGSREIGGRLCADKWSHSTDPSPKAKQAG